MINIEAKSGEIVYTGEVTFKKIRPKQPPYQLANVKNTGTVNLHKFLVNCLMRKFDSNLTPGYIQLIDDNNRSISKSPVVILNKNPIEESGGSCSVTFESIFSKHSVDNKSIKLAKLLSIKDDVELATVDLESVVELSDESNLDVVWKLIIGSSGK